MKWLQSQRGYRSCWVRLRMMAKAPKGIVAVSTHHPQMCIVSFVLNKLISFYVLNLLRLSFHYHCDYDSLGNANVALTSNIFLILTLTLLTNHLLPI